jgi:thioredoxin-like negative regulator of GroEL
LKNLSAEEFFEVTGKNAPRPVVVKFTAPWCQPCKAFTPVVAEVAISFADSIDTYEFDIDTGNAEKVVKKLGIRGVPSLRLFVRGKQKAALEGAHLADVVRALYKKAAKRRK